jgi:hypothetical protein
VRPDTDQPKHVGQSIVAIQMIKQTEAKQH